MSVSPYIDQEERESQVLRASVVEAAMTLGPKVTGWMFENAVTEEDDEEEEQVLTPDLVSSTSSDDSHSAAFSSQDGHGGPSARPLISLPSKLTPKMEQGYYLKSPFVVIDEGQFPRYMDTPEYPYVPPISTDIQRRPDLVSASSTSSISAQSAASKKSGKSFMFSKKSPSSQTLSSQSSFPGSASASSQPSHTTSSTPRKSSLDDPVPRASTPSNSGRASPSSRSPGKLKKLRIPQERKGKEVEPLLPVQGPHGWDFKDPDRPSFFATENSGPAMPPRSSSALGHVDTPKEKKKKTKKVPVEDGYMSEGTGKSKARNKEDKDKDKRPGAKRSMTSRLMSKWSAADLHAEKAKVLAPPVPPLPVPIHDKFASKGLTVSVTAERENPSEADLVRDETTQLSAEWRARSPYLDVPRSGGSVEPSPSSSTSSFALVPDLNVVARHRIGVPPSSKGSNGHAIGSDNEAKLAMLAKLISEPVAPVPVIAVQPPAPPASSSSESSNRAIGSVGPSQEVVAPSTSFIVPSPTLERRPPSSVLRYYDVPLSPKPPTPSPRSPPPAAFGNRARPHAHASAQLRVDPALAASYEAMRAGSAPPSVMTHQTQVRGRQAPFPTKPILPSAARTGTGLSRSASQSRLSTNPVLANNPRFHATPQRYRNVQNLPVPDADVPRSVRSSFEKDQEREERLDRMSDERDDRSVYSRASFMDVGKSVEAREKLVKGVDALVESGQAARGPRWF